ncbi:AsmA family protein [bacterium]|jgi:uncharacterized protein involved in outer membrane biogenesis|nr:AsmA family protein [bacterium]
MKKLLKILGVLAGVLLVLIITIPFFVNVDRFRPGLEKAVNNHLQGKFELGKLSLSLWGRIHVGVDGLKLSDSRGSPVLSVKDAAFDMPFFSILSGSPLITLMMKEPEINLSKDKAGKLNVMSLMREEGATAGTAPAKVSLEGIALPAVVLNARLGLSIENAKLTYRDEALALSNTIDQLNLRVKDFSLSRKTEAELWAELRTRMGPDLSLDGPLRMKISLQPEISGDGIKGASVSGEFSADELQIEQGRLFMKRKGIPARLSFDAGLSASALNLNRSTIVFHNAEISLRGGYSLEKGVDLQFEAKPIELKPWSELVPMLKEYELEGRVGLHGKVQGKPETLSYSANAGFEGVSVKGPGLKAKPVLQGSIDVVTDRIERLLVTVTAPGNSLKIESKVVSFSKPQVTFAVQSAGMDLDQWIDFPSPTGSAAAAAPAAAEGKGTAGPATGGTAASNTANKTAEDYDALLEPLRKNPMARAMTLDGSVSIATIKAKGFRMDDLSAKVQMRNLAVSVRPFRLKMFDGTVSGSFSTDFKPTAPAYNMNLGITGLDMKKAVESQFESFKNTLSGKLTAGFSGSGSGFNPAAAKKNLQAKGDFKVVGGEFQSMDIAKMANEAITGSIGKIAEKVPLLKGKELKVSSNAGSRYELISGTYSIRNGVLEMPDFAAKAAPKGGIDLKGYTRMGLIDESLDARWELTDTQRVTGADRLSIDIAGRTITNFLAKSEKDPVTIPVTVGCKWSAPCASYAQVAEHLAGIAANRLTGAAKDAAKEAVKQKVQEQVKDVLKKNVGDALKGLFGR